jgi:hypothetical protein
MRRRYTVNGWPLCGGFHVDLEFPEPLEHDEDRLILETLPAEGEYDAQDLVCDLMKSVGDAVMERGAVEDKIVKALDPRTTVKGGLRTLIGALRDRRRAELPIGSYCKAFR